MSSSLPPGAARVLAFVKQFMEEHSYPPTRNEIASGLGFQSANAAEEHLRNLQKRGAIQLFPGISRGIKILV